MATYLTVRKESAKYGIFAVQADDVAGLVLVSMNAATIAVEAKRYATRNAARKAMLTRCEASGEHFIY